MTVNNIRTSKPTSSTASKLLKGGKSEPVKSIAGSALVNRKENTKPTKPTKAGRK